MAVRTAHFSRFFPLRSVWHVLLTVGHKGEVELLLSVHRCRWGGGAPMSKEPWSGDPVTPFDPGGDY